MEQEFRAWLIQRGNAGAANSYPQAIRFISEHYSAQLGQKTDIYAITDQVQISQIAHDYSQGGRFSQFGYEQHGRFRNAIGRYAEFFAQNGIASNPPACCNETEPASTPDSNFAYEKDLQTSVCSQISELFPGYGIFGGNSTGIEYSISGKRIDILLEHKGDNSLLVVELKSGVADYKVFGQISMYMGLLTNQFPERKISGVIVAGSIDPSLTYACATTKEITLKVYRMSIELVDA